MEKRLRFPWTLTSVPRRRWIPIHRPGETGSSRICPWLGWSRLKLRQFSDAGNPRDLERLSLPTTSLTARCQPTIVTSSSIKKRSRPLTTPWCECPVSAGHSIRPLVNERQNSCKNIASHTSNRPSLGKRDPKIFSAQPKANLNKASS